MKFPVKAVSLSVIAAIAVIGCGKKEEAAAPAAAPAAPAAPAATVVKIGSVAPLTGGIAHLGKDNENGARLAVDEANKAGIKLGGAPVKFELVAEDDQGDPKVGNTVAQKLVDAKVAGIVGHLNSGTTIPASKISSTRGRPEVMSAAEATPPVWNVRIVSCVPGSPIDCAAMMPTATPRSTSRPVASDRP